LSRKRPIAIDIATTHFATVAGLPKAAAQPAGAATQYEKAVKTRKYGAAAADEGIGFAPVVFDTLGALGDAGLQTMRYIACKWGSRFDLKPCRSIPVIMQRINATFVRSVARILAFNTTPGDDSLPLTSIPAVTPAVAQPTPVPPLEALGGPTDELLLHGHLVACSPPFAPAAPVTSTLAAVPPPPPDATAADAGDLGRASAADHTAAAATPRATAAVPQAPENVPGALDRTASRISPRAVVGSLLPAFARHPAGGNKEGDAALAPPLTAPDAAALTGSR
jgi:hypothetical protein